MRLFLCCLSLPLYPTFISYITGITVTNLNQRNNKGLIIMHSIAFCCGLSIINVNSDLNLVLPQFW
ncbi:cytochrome c biogenesis protein CcdA [Priestia megaterium]|uniref:cytochrome c biogenesis protein CcdA n=1 Tax=Priestia megaterium TaxID=1404 RepID=UPI002E1FA9BE|nr:cytochrome c biogenesis protein CcdA [Priestia megaterium]MED4267266.1 cytochrome c biogenesis protein CcdA [Priestia megaterium]MED4274102.1 cytochrome c biogenesis protein CcdA [Priestia megaterium]MED4319426.1 cytochrome c biogenesis protein CcdA [Priestia megaterium]